jgi:hypothetical protein
MRDVLTDMQDESVRAVSEGREPDLSEHVEQAKNELSAAMTDAVELGVRNVLEAGNADADVFGVVPQRALDYLEGRVSLIASDVAQTTVDMAEVAVRNGLEQGLSVDEISSQIQGVPEYRAERIARTEVQAAVQGGKYEGFKELGVAKTNWVNAPGPSAAHALIAKRSPKAVGEPYVRAGEEIAGEKFTRDVYTPPARPNCRCDLQAILEDD